MDKLYENSETGCCQRFNPEPWNEKEIAWKNKLFIKDQVRSFAHIPLGFGKAMVKNKQMIKEADALNPQPLMLSDECSPWKTNIYIAVSKEIPGAEMEKISGTFLSKVFEGHYKNMKKWIEEMNSYVSSKNKEMKKLYFFYTTCPHCAKEYGKNYVVLLAEI
jgi:hypothetical protein